MVIQKCGENSKSDEVSTSGEVLVIASSELLADHKSVLDWSRDARRQRIIEAAGSDSNQSLITDYGFVVDEIEQLIRENKTLCHQLVIGLCMPHLLLMNSQSMDTIFTDYLTLLSYYNKYFVRVGMIQNLIVSMSYLILYMMELLQRKTGNYYSK